MPMNFPDMQSLERHAEVVKFRKPNEGESEEIYREALAKHVEPMDFLESMEIRNKVGWDKWNDEQKQEVVTRGIIRSYGEGRRRFR